MCGLVAVSNRPGTPADARETARVCLSEILHRGPDGQGVHGTYGEALGMCRLRVRTAAGDPVPLLDPSTGRAYAYCGEVYGIETASGEARTPAGGLEEALGIEQHHGGAADGMYALARLDPDGSLRLWRDPLGIKPLYLYRDAEGTVAASEVAAIARHRRLSVRTEAIAQLLFAGALLEGTFYEGVTSLLPGEHVVISRGDITERAPGATARPDGVDPAPTRPADLRSRIGAAVRAAAVSDRQIGVALSGGLDSTIVAAELAESGAGGVRTYSVLVEGDGIAALDELPLDPQRVQTWEHRALRFEPEHLLDHLPAAVAALGAPTSLSSMPMYFALARGAAEHGIVVLLLGEGADELFGGYRSYLALAAGHLDDPAAFYASARRAMLVAELMGDDLAEAARRALDDAAKRAAEQVGDPAPAVGEVVREMERTLSLGPLLDRADHLLMAAGIEGRTPLLHGGIPVTASRLALGDLVAGNRTKVPLADAYPELVGSSRRRRKHPFRAPLAAWLSGPLEHRFTQELTGRLDILDDLGIQVDRVRALLDGPIDDLHASVLFTLRTVAEWHTNHG